MNKPKGPKVPKMSDEEKDLLRTQTEILNQQLGMVTQQGEIFQMLAPFLFQDIGLEPILSKPSKGTANPAYKKIQDQLKKTPQFIKVSSPATGGQGPGADKGKTNPLDVFRNGLPGKGGTTQQLNPEWTRLQEQLKNTEQIIGASKGGEITGFKEIVDPMQRLRDKSEKLLLERSIKALEGKLPVSAQLKQELGKSERTLQESLRRSLGNDFLATTAGSEAMATFTREKENTLEAARRGDISLGEQLSLARGASNDAVQAQTLASALSIQGGGLAIPGALGGVSAGFNGPLQALMQSRQLQTQASIAGFQQPSGFGAAAGGIGALAGTLLTAPLGGTLLGSLFG